MNAGIQTNDEENKTHIDNNKFSFDCKRDSLVDFYISLFMLHMWVSNIS